MRIAVVRETREGETRVAMVPELVGKLTALGCDVVVEPDAGTAAGFADEDYVEAGASIGEDGVGDADVVVSVNALDAERIPELKSDAATVSFLPVNSSHDLVTTLRDAGVTSFAMELVPRISRAQSMDALSSQALVSGYRCGIVASELLRRFFPLNMTAAGTVQPAQVVVLGAGVAGLQAIATAKRLGAVVSAYDVRAAAAEEIRSVGAKSIDLELETLEGAGGYAREMTEDRADRQREMLTPYIADADALITTAAVPGREAPLLVTREMVEQMSPGSVVVDLAAESGGNVEGSVAGEVVEIGHAQVWGGENVPAQMPGPASTLYAQNVVNIVTLMTRKAEPAGEDGTPAVEAAFAPDFEDEIVTGACVTHDGRIEHKPTREAIEGPDPEPEPEPEPEPPAAASGADAGAGAAAAAGAAAGSAGAPPPPPSAPTDLDLETVQLVPEEEPQVYLDEPEPEPIPDEAEFGEGEVDSASAEEASEVESVVEPVATDVSTGSRSDNEPEQTVEPAETGASTSATTDTALFDLGDQGSAAEDAGSAPDEQQDEQEENR